MEETNIQRIELISQLPQKVEDNSKEMINQIQVHNYSSLLRGSLNRSPMIENSLLKIPKIIHQTWKNKNVPMEYYPWMNSWIQNHLDWEYKFWTDLENREFVKDFYPEHLHVYDSYKKNIQRVDFVRVLYLYHFGGLYVDLDFECYRSNIPLLLDRSLVFASEPLEHAKSQKRNRMLCNAWMASIPKHPFWLAVLYEMHQRASSDKVLFSTGPILLDDVYQLVYRQGFNDHIYPISIIPSELIYPKKASYPYLSEKNNNSFAVHHWKNSWVNTKKIDFPNYPGFLFYSGLDNVKEGKSYTNNNLRDIFEKMKFFRKDGFFYNGSQYYIRNIEETNDESNLSIQWPNHVGGWYKLKFKNGFPNFEGYETIINFDAPGNDVCHMSTLDLEKIKIICDSDSASLGFNSDGAIKYSLKTLQYQKNQPMGIICFYKKMNPQFIEIIPGFYFYPTFDSHGNDVERWIQSSLIKPKSNIWTNDPFDYLNIEEVKKLAEKIKDKPYCVAFNLDGNVKSGVQNQNKWKKFHPYALQGIFIRKSIVIK